MDSVNVFLVLLGWYQQDLVRLNVLDVHVVILLLLIKPPVLLVLLVNIQPTEAIVLSVLQEPSLIPLGNANVLPAILEVNPTLLVQLVTHAQLEQLDHWDCVYLVLLVVLHLVLVLLSVFHVLVVMVQMELLASCVRKVNTLLLGEIVLSVQSEQSAIQLDNANVLNVELEPNQTQH